MPNDAKLGMIVGVGLVIAIAVVFFRKEGMPGPAASEQASASAVNRPSLSDPPVSRGVVRSVKAKTAIRNDKTPAAGQRHTVSEGETLFSLARQYYQDENKFVEIYRANREVLKSPDRLTPGMVLTIPRLAD